MNGIGRRFLVRVVAWLLRDCRHGYPRMSLADIDIAVTKSYPHRDWQWRENVYAEARMINEEKKRKKQA